jgi:stage II sporulation protein D
MQHRNAPIIVVLLCLMVFATSACAATQRIEPNEPPLAPSAPPPLEPPALIEIGVSVNRPEAIIASALIARADDDRFFHIMGSQIAIRAEFDGLSLQGLPGDTLLPKARRWFIHSLPRPDGSPGPPLTLNGRRFRGSLRIELASTATAETPLLTVINVVGLEDYIRGVVPREIGFIRPENLEAMKAQAVAARTYAIRNLNRRRAQGFDLMATSDDQVYGGRDAETALTDRAVEETEGEVLLYEGALVDAFYHSTCGGATSAIAEVWSGDRPYLRGVSDALGETFACAASRYFAWSETWSGETYARFASPADSITLGILDRDTAGRARLLRIVRGESEVIARGDAIRRTLIRPTGGPLRSTLITAITAESGALRIEGRGWGHGLGMCQMGALGRARAGWRHDAILEHYYPGTRVTRIGGTGERP